MWCDSDCGEIFCPLCKQKLRLIHSNAVTAFVGDEEVNVRREKHKLEEM